MTQYKKMLQWKIPVGANRAPGLPNNISRYFLRIQYMVKVSFAVKTFFFFFNSCNHLLVAILTFVV